MLEKDLQSRCLKYVKELENKGYPIIAINQHGSAFSSRGVPDILMCIKGQFIAVELKVGDNTPTPLQSHYIERIINADGQAHVIYDLKEFKRVVDDALH
jgi:Holliday junction resolvase